MGIDTDGIDDVRLSLDELQDSLDDSASAIVGASADHANDVEFGTGPHTIEAKDAQALHFQWKGEEIFVKSVQHPGTEPQPFLRPAAREIRARGEEFMNRTESIEDMIQLAAIEATAEAIRRAPVDDGDLQNSIRWEFD